MCTVTYIPTKDTDFVFSSSRDVPYKRKKALAPKEYTYNNTKLTFPKDPQGQGSWIGLSEQQHLVCLLNGGFKKHQTKTNYAKSRGLIVTELLVEKNDLLNKVKTIDLENIEPFTIIIVSWRKNELALIELVWTGTARFIQNLNPKEEYIWSSATLYTQKMKTLREEWFNAWQKDSAQSLLDFHHNAGKENPETAVLMDRKTVGTVSISQIEKKGAQISFNYEAIDRN